MSKNLEVGVKITADSKSLVGESRASKEALNQLGDSTRKVASDTAALNNQTTAQTASLANMKTGLIAAAGAYVSLGAAIGGGKAVIDAALAQERLNNTLKVATGSTEAAARETAFLRHESERLGLQFATTADQYAKLAAAAKGTNLEGQATRDIFMAVSKAATVLGLSAAEAGGALTAIQQMISKGNVSAEELRGQLGERLPGAFQLAARAMGVTTQELDKMLVKGEVTAAQLLPALAVELEKTFGAQAQAAAQGLNAKINRLDNSFADLKVAVGNTGLIDLFTGGISGATKLVNYINTAVIPAVQSIGNIPVLGTVAKALFGAPLFAKLSELGNPSATEAFPALPAANQTVTPGTKPALPDSYVKAAEQQAKAIQKAAETEARARQKLADERAREAQRAVESAEKTIAAFKRETQEIGLNAIQKKMLAAATEAANAPTEELRREIMASAQAWVLATQQEEENLAIKKQQADAADELARREKQAAEQTQRYWSNIWGDVEQTARMAFVQFAAHGKSAMESIGESIKIAIIDVLYQLTIRKWIINIGASIGLGGSGMAMAGDMAGGGMSAINAASLGTNALSLLKGGFGFNQAAGGLLSMVGGNSSIGAFGAGMSGGAIPGVSSAATMMGSTFASVAGPAIAIAAVDQITRMLAGDKLIGGGVGKVLNYVPVLGPLLNGLFGRGPMKQQGTLLSGEIGAEGFESGYLQTRFKAKGGLFRSDKIDYARVDAMTGEVWTDNNKLLDYANDLSKTGRELFGLINDTTKQTSASLRQIGQDLGIGTEGIDNFKHSINLLSEKGKMLTEEQIGQEIEKITDGLAHSLIPQIDDLAKRGETALQAVSRLGTEFTTLVDAATLILGKTAADAKSMILGASFEDRTAFVDNAGGIDAVTQASQFFSANFLTDEERLAPQQEALNTELTKLGLSTDLTRDQFRGLVQSFGEVNGVSEETLQSLLKLQYKFVDVRNAQDQLRVAGEALYQSAIDTRRATLADEGQQLRTALDSAFGSLQRAVDKERKSVETHIDNIGKSLDKLKSLSGALQNTLGRMQSAGDAGEQRAAAQAQIATALAIARAGGALPDAASLQHSLDVVAQPSEDLYGSFVDYMRDFARTASDINSLDGLAQDQIKTQETALDIEKGQLTYLDGLLKNAQDQLDVLNGVDNSIISLTQALQNFGVAFNSVKANNSAIAGSPANLSGGVLGGAGNPAIGGRDIVAFLTSGVTPEQGLAKAMETGVSAKQIESAFAGQQGYTLSNIRSFVESKGLVPGFADGGFHTGGLRIVGERGPELEFTPPSRIFSNSQSKQLLDLSEVVSELKKLRSELEEVRKSSRQTADLLDDVSAGGSALLVEMAS